MPTKDNLIGNRYGMLTVISESGTNKHGATVWKCKCDCGTIKDILGQPLKRGDIVSCGCKKRKIHTLDKYGRLTALKPIRKEKRFYWRCICDCGNIVDVLSGNLTKGNSLSCGCLANELNSIRSTTHGETKTRLYRIWDGMKQRCTNQNVKAYVYYGERGIYVCEEWLKFENFSKWALSHGYTDDLTIDRIDVNGPYSPDNCKWSTKIEQANNKRASSYIICDGKKMTVAQWGRETGINPSTISWRKRHGWSDEECIKGKTK